MGPEPNWKRWRRGNILLTLSGIERLSSSP